MTKEKRKKLDEIIAFIIANRSNTEMIDEINKTTFPFTSKYLGYSKRDDEGREYANF